MDANTYSLKQILAQERRFVVPTFQRDYEWTRDGQWELLFDDLVAVADRLFAARRNAELTGQPVPKADRQVTPHFLGAVVLDQLPAPAGGLDLRAIIDGQQRLTTLQLLLRGVLDVLIEKESSRVKQLRRLLLNPEDIITQPHERYKVWPRRKDRELWPAVMADELPTAAEHGYVQARAYFADRARMAVTGANGEDLTDVVVDALLDMFKLVVIDLEDNDDAQVIFEVLNGRQTPLSATDLVKNLLFLRAELRDEKHLEELYERFWSPFDDEWWKVFKGRGHAARGRRDILLSSWLTAVSAEEANIGHLYGEVRRYLDAADRKTPDVLAELKEYGAAYRDVYSGSGPGTRRLRQAYQRFDQLDLMTVIPLLVWLRTIPSERLAGKDHEVAVLALESWAVRRMIIGANTRTYGKAFLEVLRAAKRAASVPDESIAHAIVTALHAAPAGLGWPDDGEVEDTFVNRQFYGVLTQERIRMLLGAIDERIQRDNPKTEPAVFDYDRLQIEHVMPQSWQSHWPLPDGDPYLSAAQERDQLVHRMGNLTLVTSDFNQGVSNQAWEVKKNELATHAKLQISAQFAGIQTWDAIAIEKRARSLATVSAFVWPSADQLLQKLDHDIVE
ncbi:DUF262 domain-containing protein [Microbispora triticiradicis]|uniref:DUF262 domain-containing protein n=1 Tax=Microbispora triticiradicis TaxID=2200763 RepID=A0ABX9LFN2_9ACTN|nr:DUF262 domain-containing protein [Microbispora triticiradicis]RGA02443.1 DUF262 domain-containing protein [Microbispora triticiradicis]